MKKRNGFTLIEVIAAIAIIGIIFVLALPQISKIMENNKKRKYIAYRDAVARGAKLYTDSNYKDMFGYNTSGCTFIEYDELKRANVLKDFQDKEVKCNNLRPVGSNTKYETYVMVTKFSTSEYDYNPRLVCKNGNEIVYEDGSEYNPADCKNEPDNIAPSLVVSPTKFDDWTTSMKANPIQITLKDEGIGFKGTTSIKYQWKKENGSLTNSWKTMNFTSSSLTKEIVKSLGKKNFPTDSGRYYLVIKADSVIDRVGNNPNRDNFEFGPYLFDNDGPVINVDMKAGTWANDTCTSTTTNYVDSKWKNYECVNVVSSVVDSDSGVVTDKITRTTTGFDTNENNTKIEITSVKAKRKEGSATITYKAEDKVGNKTVKNVVVKLDRTGPNIPTSKVRYDSSTGSIRNSADYDKWTDKTLWWGEFSATDKAGGSGTIKRYEYSTGCTGLKTHDLSSYYLYNSDKNSYYCIRAIDGAENASEWSSPYTFKVDKNKPNIQLTAYKGTLSNGVCTPGSDRFYNDQWTKADCISYTATVSDTFLSRATYQKIGYGDNATGSISVSNGSGSDTSYMRVEGNGTVRITATDQLGQTSTLDFKMNIDRTAPDIDIKAYKSDYGNSTCTRGSDRFYDDHWTKSGCISYTATVTDASLKEASYEKIGYGNDASGSISVSNGTATETSYMRKEVKGTLKITARDQAGNTKTENFKMNIDRTAPTCTAKKTATGTSGVSATFTCKDGSGSGVSSCTPDKTGLKSSQSYTIKDDIGNEGTCSVDVSSSTSCTEYKACSSCGCASRGTKCVSVKCTRNNGGGNTTATLSGSHACSSVQQYELSYLYMTVLGMERCDNGTLSCQTYCCSSYKACSDCGCKTSSTTYY